MSIPDTQRYRRWPEADAATADIPAADVEIVTSRHRKIPAHSSVLSSESPVLESMIGEQQKHESKKSRRHVIRILGVPDDSVVAFVRLLYTGRYGMKSEENVDKSSLIHLLVLSHAYRVPWLKSWSEAALAAQRTVRTVVDVLQLAQKCDAPRLHLQCLRLLAKRFTAVEKTEAWHFLQDNDPWLGMEILQFFDEVDLRRKKWHRKQADQRIFMELNVAMDCLQHICTEGCTEVGPLGGAPATSPCEQYGTCRGIQLLIRHFSKCHRKSCGRCRRMWQLLRLHSALCREDEQCKVPLCSQFKSRVQQSDVDDDDEEDEKWELLVKKVISTKVMSALAKRKEVEVQEEGSGGPSVYSSASSSLH